ncbi:MAG: HAD-IIB family hydrolase [Rhodospirillales bacterium]|nr:HAD-IIB family hydrolase [Rhodospirillales bacterium]MDH3792874.1 HAD-IIB family hydrolase [Rhodospirillales bacterium]MDH3914298.1 HAD-IIB family hydrolase [Rhodospirillales bacterium]MDH3916769.1 HAD-IIB family hydrolase [Rhodospirillales bacterium]MDH3968574.1 HAD-IIB family hydrolase [Rhodospirillales bacterium]
MDTERQEGLRPGLVVFSDLDGTLLDGNDYSFDRAEPALRLLAERRIPLVLCSSKTRSEVEFYRERFGNRDPFVVENGGAVYVPRDYFAFGFDHDRATADYLVLELGTPYETLVHALGELKRKTGIPLRGFSDMTVEEVAARCALPLRQAARAKEREYDEPVLIPREGQVAAVMAAADLPVTQGDRFYHLSASDKGRAVSVLMGLFKRAHPDAVSVGIGDTLNDLPLLDAVDVPIVVQLDDGGYDRRVVVPGLRYADGVGPAGWNAAVTMLVDGAAADLTF